MQSIKARIASKHYLAFFKALKTTGATGESLPHTSPAEPRPHHHQGKNNSSRSDDSPSKNHAPATAGKGTNRQLLSEESRRNLLDRHLDYFWSFLGDIFGAVASVVGAVVCPECDLFAIAAAGAAGTLAGDLVGGASIDQVGKYCSS